MKAHTKPTQSGKLHTLARALRLVWKSTPGWTLASGALLPLEALLTTLPIYYSKLIVDAAVASVRVPHRISAFHQVGGYIVAQAVLMLLGMVESAVSNLVRSRQAAQFADYIAEVIYSKSIAVDLEYYEEARYYDILRRVQNQAPTHPLNIINNLLSGGQAALSLLALLGLLFTLHWGIAVLLFLSTVPGAVVSLRFSRTMYGWQRKRTAAERQAGYLGTLLAGASSAKEIRLFNLGEHFLQRFRKVRMQLRRERLLLEAKNTLISLIAQGGAVVAMYSSYVFAAYRTWQGLITVGGLTMYFAAFQRAQGLLQQVLANLTGLYDSSLFLTDLSLFLDMEPRVPEPTHPKPAPVSMQGGIHFEHVDFAYTGTDRLVLKDISLSLRPGEMIALVGENGSGKTTLTKLLCRLYDVTGGRITLDGIDIREFATTDLRRQISVIFQDYEKYQLTARENIGLGDVSLPADDERIKEAAKLSGADAVIENLPSGYETVLGKMFENGAELSIGQWQKIALARAFLRNTQIIILDEPTSAMDAKAEYELFRNFRQIAQGRAAILISHRFSTVRMADCIYVLEDGRIVENGTHDKLMELDGKYAKLFEMQAQHYR